MIKLNGVTIKPTMFPDQTSQVWQIEKGLLRTTYPQGKVAKIEWDFTHEGETMHLAQLRDLISPYYDRFELYMPFLPYGRQDKSISNDSTFALCSFANFINHLKFDEVSSLDTHNADNASHFINNFKDEFPRGHIEHAMFKSNSTMTVYPDDGARKRYQGMLHWHYAVGHKTRDPKTGYITSYHLDSEGTSVDGQNVLIVDDICDGGMTFIKLANELTQQGARVITLYTTHGIYSKGLKPMVEAGISRFFSYKGEATELHDGSICYSK